MDLIRSQNDIHNNKTKWVSYGGHGNMPSGNSQLMSNGSMLVTGQKVKFHKSNI
jgi:hypothetical protein